MERALLYRNFQNDRVTFGVLKLPWTWDGSSLVKCCTLELPWLNNQPNISCIPGGLYGLEPVYSTTFGHILAVSGIEGRSLVRVHAGNHTGHTHGCILTGKRTGTYQGRPFIFNSRDALRVIVSHVQALYDQGETCELEVLDVGYAA